MVATDLSNVTAALGVLITDGGMLIMAIGKQRFTHGRPRGNFNQPAESRHPVRVGGAFSAAGDQQDGGYGYNPN